MYNTGQTAVFLKDLTGKEYPAIAEVNRKKRVNGQRELSLSFLYTEINKDFMDQLEFGWKVLFDNEWYTITNPGYSTEGDYLAIDVTAILSFFVDLNGYYMQDKAEDKSSTAIDYFSNLFEGTPYSYVLVSNLAANTLSYQDNQSKTERFLYGIDRFNAEYKVQGNVAYIHDQIGSDKDVILHEDLNVNSVKIDVDASGFHTFAKGYGDLPEDDLEGDYQLEVEYRSPLIDKYGPIEGPAIKDGNYKQASTLTAAVKNQVENSYIVSTEIEAVDLTNNGYLEMVFEEGDRIWLYVSKLNLNQQVRVMEVEEYFDWEGNIIDARYIVGNEGIASRYKTQQYNTIKDFQDISSGRKQLAYDWLPAAVKRASEIINGNQDSLFKYGAGEIIGINQSNPNGYMRFNTDGIGFSRDGGKTYQTAITYEGINADYIVAGTLRSILIEGVEIYGSVIKSQGVTEINYTEIEGGYLESRGQFKRTWAGETTNNDVSLRLENGYIRARNNTLDRSLYYSDFGISTFNDAEGEEGGSSGSILWWDTKYSDANAHGLTVNSHGGVVALESDLNRIMINAYQSANIESKIASVYIRPNTTSHPGNNTFSFGVFDAETSSYTDGRLLYGSYVNGYSSGLRFSKTISDPIVSVIDGNGERGGNTTLDSGRVYTNTIRKRDGTGGVYWNGSGTGTTGGDIANIDNTLYASGIRARLGDSDIHLATDQGGAVRVTNYAGYNSGNGLTYRPIYASEFNPASSILYKDNIEPFEENGIDIVKDHQVFTYFLKSDLEEAIYDNKQIGFIAEAAPMLRKGDTINLYKAVSINWKATQEIIVELEEVKVHMDQWETDNDTLISDLLNRVSKLEVSLSRAQSNLRE